MLNASPSNLPSLWARTGAMFNVHPADSSPDLEILVIETARHLGENPRLFIMAATWLSLYGDLISSDRLGKLIEEEHDQNLSAVLGLLLDEVKAISGSGHFDEVIAKCRPATEPRPLFEISNRNPTLRKLAERHASPLSKKWNLWADPFEPKYNAIRPKSWIAAMNPGFGIDLTLDAPKKMRGYVIAADTTDPVQRAAMREPDVETGGGRNTRHSKRSAD